MLQILQLAVLSILLTAPTGAALIAVFGPLMLHRDAGSDQLRKGSEVYAQDVEEEAGPRDSAGGAAGVVVMEGGDGGGLGVSGGGRDGCLRSVDKEKVGGEDRGQEEEEGMDTAVDSADTRL